MKIWFMGIAVLFIFSGCSTKTQNYRLRMLAAQQIGTINKQRAVIEALRAQLKAKKTARTVRRRQRKTHAPVSTLPAPPKKNIELKKVEDTNYSSSYMYPSSKRKASVPKTNTVSLPTPNNPSSTSTPVQNQGMTKLECISMIGQDKFDRYTQMFGSETASIKRCKMLKAMKN